jgi:hypothetical protein
LAPFVLGLLPKVLTMCSPSAAASENV